jgi:CBS domain-containing protein
MQARDVMTPAPATIGPDASLADLEALLLAKRVGGVPVVEHGKLVGIVSRSDVVRMLGTEQAVADTQSDFYREFYGEPYASTAASSPEAASEQVARRLAHLRVRDAMVADVITVAADAPLREVAQRLVEHHIHRVVVTSDGALAGIVTALDLVRLVAEGPPA